MIYERGSLESRAMKMPSAWKSNKHPLWIGEWGGGMYRKPFTGWSCIKQTSPPQIFMGRDLLINLSLSSISLFCIHQELGAVIGYNQLLLLHFSGLWVLTVTCISTGAAGSEWTHCLPFLMCRGYQLWGCHVVFCDERIRWDFKLRGLSGRGVWVTTRHRAHWSLAGCLHQRRCCLAERTDFHSSIQLQVRQPKWTNRRWWKKYFDPSLKEKCQYVSTVWKPWTQVKVLHLKDRCFENRPFHHDSWHRECGSNVGHD